MNENTIGLRTSNHTESDRDIKVELWMDQEVQTGICLAIDKNWTYFDNEGHYHYVDKNGELPTLNRVITEKWVGDSIVGEPMMSVSSKYLCKHCGEEVSPVRSAQSNPIYRPARWGGTIIATSDAAEIQELGLSDKFHVDNFSNKWKGEAVVTAISTDMSTGGTDRIIDFVGMGQLTPIR